MKNKLLYVLFMILILPFFVFLTLSLGNNVSGDKLLNSFYSFDVEKSDGETDPEGKEFSFTVSEDENVSMSYSWDVEEPDFITCFSITDEDGEIMYSSSAFQISESGIRLNLKKGVYYVKYEFISDEDAFRDACEEYEIFESDDDLDDYIDQVDFDDFEDESSATFELSIDITEYAQMPGWIKALALVLGIVEICLLVILLISDKNGDDTIKDRMNNVALRYTLFGLVVTCSQVFFAYLVRFFLTDISNEVRTNLNFALIILSVDVVGFSLIYMLCKKIPANKVEKRSIGFGMYLIYALMTIGLVFVGAIIGMILHLIFSSSASDTSSLADLLYNSNPLPRILTVGILAPIFEELIFRKVLIDRLNKFGALISVLASGLFFGLFHGNFQQFFFAALVGGLWAVLYLKTGKIYLTIGLHMMINCGTSAVTTFLITHAVDGALLTGEVTEEMALQAMVDPYFIGLMIWLMFIMLSAVAGFIVFIVFACTGKFKVTDNTAPAPMPQGFPQGGEMQNAQWGGYAAPYPYDGTLQQAAEFTPDQAPVVKPAIKPVAAFFGAKYTWAFILMCVGLFLMSYI
ncbi:MAG: CPBP family intramembrane metalloprotease [Lachnospiraceae bacterium]|nr:CPBP family intramembrane metalloprotease [Lachnospiraceae bacterium]